MHSRTADTPGPLTAALPTTDDRGDRRRRWADALDALGRKARAAAGRLLETRRQARPRHVPPQPPPALEQLLTALEAEQRERSRVSRVLHDDVQQLLAAACLELTLPDGRERGQALVRLALTETRTLAHELAADRSGQPLSERLRVTVAHFRTRYRLDVRLTGDGTLERADDVGDVTAWVLSGAVRELLFNATKLAAVRVTVSAEGGHGWVALTVRDDGPGLPVEPPTAGLGLREVQRRIRSIGGYFDVHMPANGGTCFTLCAPAALPPSDGRPVLTSR